MYLGSTAVNRFMRPDKKYREMLDKGETIVDKKEENKIDRNIFNLPPNKREK